MATKKNPAEKKEYEIKEKEKLDILEDYDEFEEEPETAFQEDIWDGRRQGIPSRYSRTRI